MKYSRSFGILGDRWAERGQYVVLYQSQELWKEKAPTVGKLKFGGKKN
jgi:hypothetical protein